MNKHLGLLAIGLVLAFGQTRTNADIVFNEFDFTGNGQVELVNTGSSSVDISDWWFCNRVNGSPFYDQVDDLATSSSGSFNLAVGELITVTFTGGNFLPAGQGELGLYTTNSFGNSNAIEEYVQWGADFGARDSVADGAGIWTNGDFIDVTSLATGESVQLNPNGSSNANGHLGISSDDYFFAPSSFGVANVPEPGSAIVLTGLAGLVLIRRKRDR